MKSILSVFLMSLMMISSPAWAKSKCQKGDKDYHVVKCKAGSVRKSVCLKKSRKYSEKRTSSYCNKAKKKTAARSNKKAKKKG